MEVRFIALSLNGSKCNYESKTPPARLADGVCACPPLLGCRRSSSLSLLTLVPGEWPVGMDAGYTILASRAEARLVRGSLQRLLSGICGFIEDAAGRRLRHHEHSKYLAVDVRGREVVGKH